MTPERWARVEGIFLEVVDLPRADRNRHLDQACNGDADLRKEVESLLQHDEPTQPLLSFLPPPSEDPNESGRRIGPYRVVRLLGRGGMGAVYLAARDDDQFQKQVAIKLLKRGMDTDAMLQRFRQERQILANLEHPFIARLLDGGATDDGLPYFVLEYVDGLPITKYCDEKKLTIEERLSVFRLVCEAVQYAHQSLVVHCDLKPGNILITNEGVPKLLDFGIAKVMNPAQGDSQTLTVREQRLMTPDYASPEQVMGLPSSTSVDIYALGIVLYELLVGERPHKLTGSSLAEIERTICQTEPPRPSVASGKKELAGDLDAIVLNALRKEPQRRYASAAALSEDIRRHNDGLPVMARSDRWSYRTQKFIRRHRLGVAAAAILAITLLGGIIATTYQAQRAQRRFLLVRQLANSVLGDLTDRVRRLPGSTEAQMAMLQTVVKYLDALAEDVGSDPQLDLEIAGAYSSVAGLEWPHLGQSDAARTHFLKALDLLKRVENDPEVGPRALATAVYDHVEVNVVLRSMGKPADAFHHLQMAAAIAEDPKKGQSVSTSTRVNLYNALASTAWEQGDFKAEQTYGRRVVELSEERARSGRTPAALDSLRSSYLALGDAYKHGGDFPEALKSYEKALVASQEIVRRSDVTWAQEFAMGSIHHVYGDLLGATDDPNMGDQAGALAHYREAARIHSKLVEADPKDVNSRRNLAGSYRRVGLMLLDSNPTEALDAYRKAVVLAKAISDGDPANVQYQSALADGIAGEGAALHALHRDKEAIPVLRRVIEMQNAIEQADPNRTSYLRTMSRAYVVLGHALLAEGDVTGARRAYQDAVASSERMLQRAPSSMYHSLDLAEALEALGRFDAARASKASPTQRTELLQAARRNLGSSLNIWKDWIERDQAASYAERRRRPVQEELAALPNG